jgi:hypothetical protein
MKFDINVQNLAIFKLGGSTKEVDVLEKLSTDVSQQ